MLVMPVKAMEVVSKRAGKGRRKAKCGIVEPSEVRVRTSGPGLPKVLNMDLNRGPVLPGSMNPNLNIGSGSCPNLVQNVREPDHGQSKSECPLLAHVHSVA